MHALLATFIKALVAILARVLAQWGKEWAEQRRVSQAEQNKIEEEARVKEAMDAVVRHDRAGASERLRDRSF